MADNAHLIVTATSNHYMANGDRDMGALEGKIYVFEVNLSTASKLDKKAETFVDISSKSSPVTHSLKDEAAPA